MIRRLVVGDQLAQHRHEDVDRVRRVAFLVRQPAPAKRVVGAVHLRAAVDQEERRTGHSTNDNHCFRCFRCPAFVRDALAACSILGPPVACGGGILAQGIRVRRRALPPARRLRDGERQARRSRRSWRCAAFDLPIAIRMRASTATRSGRCSQGPGATSASVRVSRRDGRRFVHVRIDVDRRAAAVAGARRSRGRRYQFRSRAATCSSTSRVVGAAVREGRWRRAAGTATSSSRSSMHIPSEIPYHNAPSKQVRARQHPEWEQPLAERLKSVPARGRGATWSRSRFSTRRCCSSDSTIVLAAVDVRRGDLAGRPTRS